MMRGGAYPSANASIARGPQYHQGQIRPTPLGRQWAMGAKVFCGRSALQEMGRSQVEGRRFEKYFVASIHVIVI